MQRRNLVVAIDGPSGSGKSTVARGVATRLGLRYLDTGAMYRAVTWLALDRGVALDVPADLEALANEAKLDITPDPAAPAITVDGTDVTAAVRGAEVTAAVSAVSAVPGVRSAMVARQREVIGEGAIVVEGRDIGTTVAPDAAVKVFLIADPAARAQRRALQDADGDVAETLSVTDTEADLARRDAADSTRAASPLTQAPDAVVIDSTHLDAASVIARVVELAQAVTG
ncbi:MAG TPA: (d)CMP kinase [Mycobacteriales bacterium]|nr:(d)CMP kinase [Mycobacteriales bacterium]